MDSFHQKEVVEVPRLRSTKSIFWVALEADRDFLGCLRGSALARVHLIGVQAHPRVNLDPQRS